MVERLTGQHPKDQVQQPIDSAIASFCSGFNKPSTRVSYQRDLRDFFNFVGVEVSDLSQLTHDFIDNYLKHCIGQGFSKATIGRRTLSLKNFLDRAGMGELAKATGDIGNKYIGSRPEMQPFHPLSTEEVEKLQEVSQGNSRDAAFIAIALGTGANVTEILDLRASNIVEADDQVSVRFGGEHERIARLSPYASSIVKNHRGCRQGDMPLFIKELLNKQGEKPLTREGLWKVLKGYGDFIGRPDINPRVLRQTFITNLSEEDPKKLAQLLGVADNFGYLLLKRRHLTQQLLQSGILFEATTK